MATLLEIAREATRQAGLIEPSVVAGSNEETGRRLFALANRTGRRLQRRHAWQRLARVHTFSTVANQSAYDLPADFQRLIPGTAWDRELARPLHGPANEREFQALESGKATPEVPRWFALRRNEIVLSPTPATAGDTIAFTYVSRHWVDTDNDGVADSSEFTHDTDEPVLDDELLITGISWRALQTAGSPYQEQFNEHERLVSQAMAADGGQPAIVFTSHGAPFFDVDKNLPETDFG